MIINDIHFRDSDVNKLVIHQHAHVEQQIVDHLTHQRMMSMLPITCRKSTEHAAHLPAW